MDKLPNDTRDIFLTPEFIAKSDKDIATIASLNDLALRKGGFLALSGGYATESHCSGTVVRAHSDIDAKFVFDVTPENNKPLFDEIEGILDKEDTKWGVRNRGPGSAIYIEDDESKEFFNKRRLEIRVPVKGFYDAAFQPGALMDSKGRVVKVMVLGLTDLVTHKIQKLYEVRNGINTANDRHTSASDYYDLKRLLALRQLDTNAVMEKLKRRAKSAEKAQAQWDYVFEILEKSK
jgi:hypothetical protein